MSDQGWTAIDLDRTLAHSDGEHGEGEIGEPIKPMISRVKQMLDEGKTVKIFTARAHKAKPEHIKAIQDWTEKHLGHRLEVTNVKDGNMDRLYDDRAIGVVPNQGTLVGPDPETASERIKKDLRKIAK